MSDNGSIFQRLTQLFRSGPTIKRKVRPDLLKTTSTSIDTFKRSHNDVYSNVMSAYGSFDRMSRYSDYSEMEATPELSAGLDIYAEETTSADETGRSLHIFCEDEAKKEILETLFYDTLNVEFNLTMWVRNLVKYGDFFLFNDIDPNYGIINAYPIPISEIEREEGFDPDNPSAVRFRWITRGNSTLENWQVSHFRLLGNDAFLPYGSSVLEAARRIWRQLILIEDAMLVYRVIRAPERRVFYIDVGNVPPEDVPNYLEQATSALKKSPVIDKMTGKVDLRYNPLPVWSKTPIPLLDGRTITIEELAREHEAGKENWVYSIQDETHSVVPGRVSWCGKNYTAQVLTKVWLDDDTWVMTAPEHPFVMRDGSSRRADELRPGDSLMPLYRRVTNRGYEEVYNPASDSYEKTHKLVAKDVYTEVWENTELRTVHHKEPWNNPQNKLNNDPRNLQVMNFWEHRKWHVENIQFTANKPELLEKRSKAITVYNKSSEKRMKTREDNVKRNSVSAMSWYNGSDLHTSHNEARKEAQLNSWAENREERSKAMKMIIPKECFDIAGEVLKNDPSLNKERLFEVLKGMPNFREAWESANSHNKRSFEKLASKTFARYLPEAGYKDFYDFKKTHVNEIKNHKVTKVETVNSEEDVYCMTVIGPNGEDDRHNFAVQSFEQDLKSNYNGIFVKNSVDEDYFIPVRGGDSGTKIDSLAGGQNASAIEDVEYIQKKLFAALKIPRAYLGYDESVGCFTGDTKVSLLDGREVEFSKLAEEHEAGKQNWVYSFDSAGRPKPGKILNAWETKLVDKIYIVKLDNGEEMKCTGNHLFMMRDGSYVRADELKSGMSCMALYRADSNKNNRDFASGYEKVYDHSTDSWIYTHKMVTENCALQEHDSYHAEKVSVVHNSEAIEVKNHKIAEVRIEILSEPVPVYDLEIETWSNFSLTSGVVVHNSKATLAQEDIRFSRTIQRIQKTIIAELNKIAMIHLYIHGFTDEDLLNFELKLSNPSSVAQLQKLELISTRFDIAGKTPEGMLDRRWVQKNVLGLTDKQINEIQKGRLNDKQEDLGIENAAPPGEGGGGADEEEGGLFSGDVPKGENLLTSTPVNDPITGSRGNLSDPDDDRDEDDIDMSKLSINDLEAPIKAQAQITKKSHSNSPSKTHMPDFKGMVTHSRKQDSLHNPYGDDFLRTAFEGIDYERDDTYEKKTSFKSTMTPEMKSVFNSLVNILVPNNGTILSESADNEDFFDEQETENHDED